MDDQVTERRLAHGPVVTHYDDLGSIVYRVRTPILLYALDRWFRGAEILFDRIEWRWPAAAPIAVIPCKLYARWSALRAMHEVVDRLEPKPGALVPDRLMLDSMVFDALLEEGAMLDALRHDDSVELLVTHVQVDELMDTAGRDLERTKMLIHALLQSGAKEVDTHGVVVGHSRLGLAALATDDTPIEAFTEGNPDHLEDSLIAATADHLGVVLVTAEKRLLRHKTHFPGLTVWTIHDLRHRILGIPTDLPAAPSTVD